MAQHRTSRRVSKDLPARTFTLELANRAIPYVRRIVTDIVAAHHKAEEIQTTLASSPVGGGRSVKQTELQGAMDRLHELEAELHQVGVKLKDNATGLVDFPSLHRGKPVFLAYEPSQDRISHFHPQDSAGRLPVESLDERPASV